MLIILKLIRFIKGYLVIKVFGDNKEKILNICAANNLKVWNMVYKKGIITGCTDISSFIKLRTLKRGSDIHIKITAKRGLPFILHKYKKRSGLAAGIILFFILLKFLSLFIWDIEVTGNKTVKATEIISQCEKMGIKEGVKVNSIDTKKAPLTLLLQDKRLAWASFNIEGCRLTVNISETTKISGKKNQPSNIIALRDGTVLSVTASEGDVLVKPGDTVKKGDILISGVINNMSSTVFSRSSGIITAKTVRKFESYKSYRQKVKVSAGKVKKKRVLIFFSLKIPLYFGKIGDAEVQSTKTGYFILCGKNMPCRLYSVKYRDAFSESLSYSEESIKEALRKDIDEQLKDEKILSFNQLDETVIKDEKGIHLLKTFSCEEIISGEKEIIIDTVN